MGELCPYHDKQNNTISATLHVQSKEGAKPRIKEAKTQYSNVTNFVAAVTI